MPEEVTMEATAKVVIIGAGIVGCSTAYHLGALGWTDVVVIDQGPLFETGGSSSHAPGLVFQTNPSKTMTELASYTVQRYGEASLDGQPCFHPVGGIEVAATPERWTDLKRKHGLARSWGVEAHLIDPAEVADRIPLVDPARILGGFWVPSDGIAKPVRACASMAGDAEARGVRFHGDTEVTGFRIAGGRVRAVETTRGVIAAETVLCCAGIWGPRIGRMAGVSIPVQPMAHQYAWTTPVARLAGATEEVTHPILRHQDRSMYFRQQGDSYGIGSYQHRAMPIGADEIRSRRDAGVMPSVLSFTEDDFKQPWQDAQDLLPALGETGIARGINGLFLFTSDGMPVLGESRAVRGFWVAEAVWITHAGGVGRAMAEWVATGKPSIDLREADLHRFEEFAHSPTYVRARSSQNFREVYDIIHPLQPMEEPRPLRVSPFHQRQRELNATFLEGSGWERPQWYGANAALTHGRHVPSRERWAARYWSPIVGAEHLATRERVAMFDMTPLKKAEVWGPGALGFLQHLSSNQLDKPVGSVTYTLLLDEHGGVRSDLTVARVGDARFQVGCNGPLDLDWMQRHAPRDGSVQVRDITAATCCVGLWGPQARSVLEQLTDDDVSHAGFGFFKARRIHVRELPVLALRLSYVGELGWELYTSADLGLRLWDLLWRAGRPHGVVAAGRGAFDSLRLEKGYRSWGKDMWAEHDPYEAGLEFAVRMDKGDFVGRAALERRGDAPGRRLTCLVLDDPAKVVMGKEPVFARTGGLRPPGTHRSDAADAAVGFVTSAAHGYSVGASIVYAWLPAELSEPGTRLEVEYFGERYPASTAADPLFDPRMERMRR